MKVSGLTDLHLCGDCCTFPVIFNDALDELGELHRGWDVEDEQTTNGVYHGMCDDLCDFIQILWLVR